jgi:hypothetical protein
MFPVMGPLVKESRNTLLDRGSRRDGRLVGTNRMSVTSALWRHYDQWPKLPVIAFELSRLRRQGSVGRDPRAFGVIER